MYKEIRNHMGKCPVVSGGVRWYVQWEQVAEMHHFGVERIIHTVLPVCEQKKWSEESVKKLTSLANEKNIPKILVEFEVVSQIGKIFCESTHALEGYDPLGASC